jgi:golgi-specific brefeldin A-resistance guanine nucleotide exchange factor 1
MHTLVRQVFCRLESLNPKQEESKMSPLDGASSKTEMKMVLQASQTPNPSSSVDVSTNELLQGDPGNREGHKRDAQGTGLSIQECTYDLIYSRSLPKLMAVAVPQYGLPSITELLRVLVNLLDPMDQQHTDSTRITSLRILNVALEVSGTYFGDYPSLSSIMFDHGCKYLFQLARSENPTVLYLSLRVISTLFDTLRPHLKLQQELFLAFTIDRLAPPEPSVFPKPQLQLTTASRSGSGSSYSMSPNPSLLEEGDSEMGSETPPPRPTVAPAKGETRELMLEMLSSLASPPSFMVDLWTNYDSDLNCEDLYERLITFLTRVSGMSS